MTAPGDISAALSFGVRWPSRWVVRYVAETGSTNEDLLRAAERGAVGDRTVLLTGYQTAGRGRLDRRWDAPPGANLLASIYLADPPPVPSELTQRVGVALVRAVDLVRSDAPTSAESARVGLKWPNDVLLDGHKLAGVLAQRSTNVSGIVVGFGVNVGWAPPGAADLGAAADVTPAGLLAEVLAEYDRLPDDIADAYRERLVTIGQQVRVELPGGTAQSGRAVDVDSTGRLVVVDRDGGEHRFDVGDVIHLRREG